MRLNDKNFQASIFCLIKFIWRDPDMRTLERTRKMVNLALVSALAIVAMLYIRIPVILFLSYEPKDVVIVIAGFIYGPMAVLLVSLVVSFVEMFTASGAGWVGFVMNVTATCTFGCTAAYIYQKNKSLFGAAIGLIAGSLTATAAMLLFNYIFVPIFFVDRPREMMAPMIMSVFLPFNLLKTSINSTIILMVYKPVVRALRRANLIPPSNAAVPVGGGAEQGGKLKPGLYLVTGFILATCILTVLSIRGII